VSLFRFTKRSGFARIAFTFAVNSTVPVVLAEATNYVEQRIMKILPPPPRSFTGAHSECRVIIYNPDVTNLYPDQFFVSN
jgi:hypothetical protein